MYYWEYIISVFNSIDDIEEERSGVVAAADLIEAVTFLNKEYGDEIMDIQTLKIIAEDVLDFKDVNGEDGFDFGIWKKA